MISAIYGLPMVTGQSRVVRGCRIEHVCGNPDLSTADDFAYGMKITNTALTALETLVTEPTLFDPDGNAVEATTDASHAS
jgi:hypothetical protein